MSLFCSLEGIDQDVEIPDLVNDFLKVFQDQVVIILGQGC